MAQEAKLKEEGRQAPGWGRLTEGLWRRGGKPPLIAGVKKKRDIWNKTPADEDYPAAQNFLSLLFADAEARQLVDTLREAPTVERQAKDLLRASRTHLIARDNAHVAADLNRIEKGRKLSPVLLVRGNARSGVDLIIADGAHRICAGWHWDEDAPIACRIAGFPGETAGNGRRGRRPA